MSVNYLPHGVDACSFSGHFSALVDQPIALVGETLVLFGNLVSFNLLIDPLRLEFLSGHLNLRPDTAKTFLVVAESFGLFTNHSGSRFHVADLARRECPTLSSAVSFCVELGRFILESLLLFNELVLASLNFLLGQLELVSVRAQEVATLGKSIGIGLQEHLFRSNLFAARAQ